MRRVCVCDRRTPGEISSYFSSLSVTHVKLGGDDFPMLHDLYSDYAAGGLRHGLFKYIPE